MKNLQPHICLDDSLGIRYAILPGDPKRLDHIAKYLDNPEELAYNREFRSLAGLYKGVPVLALSTGIGGASAGIAVEELKNIGVDTMVRIGSCGALQNGIQLGDLIIANGAVRDDGASRTYGELAFPAVPNPELMMHCVEAAKEMGYPYHLGIARSHDSFYRDDEAEISAYWARTRMGVLGCDMETAALFTIGGLRGVRTASILNNVVLSDEETAESIGAYVDGESLTFEGEKREILVALEAIYKMDQGR